MSIRRIKEYYYLFNCLSTKYLCYLTDIIYYILRKRNLDYYTMCSYYDESSPNVERVIEECSK